MSDDSDQANSKAEQARFDGSQDLYTAPRAMFSIAAAGYEIAKTLYLLVEQGGSPGMGQDN